MIKDEAGDVSVSGAKRRKCLRDPLRDRQLLMVRCHDAPADQKFSLVVSLRFFSITRKRFDAYFRGTSCTNR
ncbi:MULTISPECIES: hypothetical protein [unclassified Methylobacterium]|uniref:hypothetical protein n=1 Tax=unclassified Methylobacterium TaxID=2615210 RepID=UPI0016505FC9|nr:MULTISPECIES: hypothetical protein [unclassified Methylobacterium]